VAVTQGGGLAPRRVSHLSRDALSVNFGCVEPLVVGGADAEQPLVGLKLIPPVAGTARPILKADLALPLVMTYASK
jgi:hypothetical protein